MYLGALLAYPFLEILTFVAVAGAIGWSEAILLTIATSFLGYALIRCQRRWQIFGSNDFTARSLENYLFSNLGALALLLPGFISDVFGILVIIPWTRRLLISFFHLVHFDVTKHSSGPFSVFKTYNFGQGTRQNYGAESSSNDYEANYDSYHDEIIDVEPTPGKDDDARKKKDENDSDDAIDVEFTVRD